MEKREVDEQLKNLSFDMDAEIDDRIERRGRRATSYRHALQPMETSHAIILAAVIIVGGLWGGKLFYDYIQEQRMKAALNEAALYMQQSMKRAEQDSRQAQAEIHQRMAAVEAAREKHRAEQLANRQAEQSRLAQEKRLASAECQFWWQQYNQPPNERNAQKKSEACESQ